MVQNEKVEVVRRAFEAFNSRNLEAMLETVGPEIEFPPVTRVLADKDKPRQGHSGIRTYFRDVSQRWRELRVTALRYVEFGDHVAVYGRVQGHAADGTTVDSPADWIWQVLDRKIVWGCVYAKRDEAPPAV
jgi:ketosteroid isomerase-like protein